MTQRESVLVLALAVVLAVATGLLTAGYGRPGLVQTVIVPAPTPVDWGYNVGPGWQEHATGAQTVYPWPTATATPTPTQNGMDALVHAMLLATPPGATPTSVFLQVPENVAWMIADASRNYYGERIGTLTEADNDSLFWQGGRTFELGVQITKRHSLWTSQGQWFFMVFAEGIVVQKEGDLRIGILSPHGRWSSYAPPLIPTPAR